jgi:thioredoxin 1
MSVFHFWSQTCEPCKAIKPVIEDLKEDFPELVWNSIDIHNDPENIREKYDVKFVPTIVTISAGGKISKHSGTNAAGYYRIMREASKE